VGDREGGRDDAQEDCPGPKEPQLDMRLDHLDWVEISVPFFITSGRVRRKGARKGDEEAKREG